MAKIGRYEIVKELGRGGMATVYLALDPRIKREVAIKVLPHQFTHDPRFLVRFEQEAQTVAALEDPAIVPIHDFGEHDDAPYIVMRYMSGGSLRDRLVGRPLPLVEIDRILQRLAPALDKAHRRGIIHRDLKPDNVLFDGEGRPYLADFGIARMAEATHTITIIGTPAYMSPEQVRGEQKLDWRSDLYALGVMLFEMLTGRQPYEAETPSGQMFKHAMEPVPDGLLINPDLPPQSQTIIEKAMDKDRQQRYQSAGEIVTALKGLLAVEGVLEEAKEIAAEESAAAEGFDLINDKATKILPWPTPADETGPGTGIDTPPELKNMPPPDVEATVAEKQPAPAERLEDHPKPPKFPAWLWLGGAVLILILIILGSWALLRTLSEPAVRLGQREKDGAAMVFVPGGTFLMGSVDGQSDEAPVHDVLLDEFWIDQKEVTYSQFAAFLNEMGNQEEGGVTWIDLQDSNVQMREQNGEYIVEPDFAGHPVVEVSWYGAAAYCDWAGGWLPTEAEWEFAARGPEWWVYPWGDAFDGQRGNYCDVNCTHDWRDESYDDGFAQTSPTGSYGDGRSPVGALDMAGNVWEWVNDWYSESYYSTSPTANPTGPAVGSEKVLRGGAWNVEAFNLRSGNRNHFAPAGRIDSFGFRCMVP